MEYIGYPVLDIRPSQVYDSPEATANFVSLAESPAGAFSLEWVSYAHPKERRLELYCNDRQAIADAKAFIAALAGRYGAFWVPTWVNDFRLLQGAAINSSVFTVSDSGKGAIRSHVAVITSGAIYPRSISSYVGGTLSVGSLVPEALSPSSTMISYLAFVRLATDDVTMNFVTMDSAEISLPVIELVV